MDDGWWWRLECNQMLNNRRNFYMMNERVLTGDRVTGKLHLGHYMRQLADPSSPSGAI